MGMLTITDRSRENTRARRGRGLTSTAFAQLTNAIKRIPVGAVVNTLIDVLPGEIHLPGGYQYCGPGTKLTERLARGDPGINELDKACREHDISYSKYSDTASRSVADRKLAEKAWSRVKSSDASLAERAAALAVTAAMKAKSAIGGGYRSGGKGKRTRHSKKGKGHSGGKKRSTHRRKGKGRRSELWSMIRSGKGLYLKPYRNV